jgi:hypothetical protein
MQLFKSRYSWNGRSQKKGLKHSKITFNYIVYNDQGREQWPWELPAITTVAFLALALAKLLAKGSDPPGQVFSLE